MDNYDSDDSINFEKTYYKIQLKLISDFTKNHKLVEIDINDLKIGNKVVIHFTTYSQKYMYHLYSRYGTIIKIEDKMEIPNNILLQNDHNIYDLLYPDLSIYGSGYDYIIYLLIDK